MRAAKECSHDIYYRSRAVVSRGMGRYQLLFLINDVRRIYAQNICCIFGCAFAADSFGVRSNV